jgi:uncharacterized protein (TIGR02588 family)
MAEQGRPPTGSAEQRMAERQGRGEISPWEQAVALLGALLVAAVLGYLGWRLATEVDGPPVLRLQAGASRPNGSGHLVGFEAFNEGATTATALEVVGRLERDDGAVVEESRATVDYLPPESSRQGGLFFARDPTAFNLVLRPGGYADP